MPDTKVQSVNMFLSSLAATVAFGRHHRSVQIYCVIVDTCPDLSQGRAYFSLSSRHLSPKKVPHLLSFVAFGFMVGNGGRCKGGLWFLWHCCTILLYHLFPAHITALSKLTVMFRENISGPCLSVLQSTLFHSWTHIRQKIWIQHTCQVAKS